MWNGAGSVSPAGRACDWGGPCNCESCVARRGDMVLRWDTPQASEERASEALSIVYPIEAAAPDGAREKLAEVMAQLSAAREQMMVWTAVVDLHAARVKMMSEEINRGKAAATIAAAKLDISHYEEAVKKYERDVNRFAEWSGRVWERL